MNLDGYEAMLEVQLLNRQRSQKVGRIIMNAELNVDLKDGEFDCRSCLAEEQVRTGTSPTRDAAAAGADGRGDDDWRNMKLDSSSANDLTEAQRSQQTTPVEQDPTSVSNPASLQATKVKTLSGQVI